MFVDQIFEECAEILGTTDEKRVYRKITQAVQTLMESGHWMQSTADVDVCTGWDGYTIALPRGIDVPLAVNVDGSPVYFRNRLFQYHVNKGGKFNTVEWAWDDRGYVATLMQIVQPSQLVAIAESENDVGKIIRVTGTDSNNRDLRSQLKDGTGVDGLLIPIHSQSDFAYGTIAPDDATIRTREVAITPISKFASATPHTLDSGQGMAITAISGTIPVPLSNGQVYYIGVLDALTIQIYSDSLNAQSGNYPISLQSIVGAGPLKFLDSRTSFVVTALQFASAPTIGITTANPITFPSGQTLPIGLRSGVTFFGNLLDPKHLQIFSSISDAQANVNEINTTGSIIPINVDIRKEIVPETKLTFSVKHYFNDGDQVQAFTNTGILPQPLIENQNYFVNVIDSYAVSLHSNQADALSSTPTNFVNPIKITTTGIGTNSLVKLLQATATTGTKQQISVNGLNIEPATGIGGIGTPVVVGSVTSVSIVSGGASYTSTPNVTFSSPDQSNLTDGPLEGQGRTAKGTAIFNTISGEVDSIVITDPGFGYSSNPTVYIQPPNPDPKNIFKITVASTHVARVYISGTFPSSWAANVTSVTLTGTGKPVYDGQTFLLTAVVSASSYVEFSVGASTAVASAALGQISLASGSGSATATAGITTSFVSKVNITSGGSGYNGSPQIKFEGSTGGGATATATTADGVITEIKVITTGTNYENPPSVTIIPSTGVFVGFTSTGTLPSPLQVGTAYLAQDPIVGKFTVQNSDFTDVNITSSGTGTLYVSLSRAFGVNWTNNWLGDFTNLLNNEEIYFGTDYLLPATIPPIDNGVTPFYLYKINNTASQIYDKLLQISSITCNNKIATAITTIANTYSIGDVVKISGATPNDYNGDVRLLSVNSLDNSFTYAVSSNLSNNTSVNVTAQRIIVPISFGTGQTYFAKRFSVSPLPYNNLIQPSSVQFLQENETVRFSTSSILPSPLVAGTDYQVKVVGDSVNVYLGGVLVPITSPGTGQLALDIQRTLNVSPSTSIVADASLFTTGQSVTVRSSSGDVLPTGLVSGTTYFIRRIDNNEFELYATKAQSQNLSSNVGRKEFLTSGLSTDSKFFVDAIQDPILVKSVANIQKPLTDGFVSLYAMDYGRSNDLTLIGQYHPTEINPQYRRIRIGKPCAWARIAYRIKPPVITSKYDYIPIEHDRAIITAVHACDLEDKDFAEQALRYWGFSLAYLKNQQEHQDGHAFVPPQINSETYGDTSDPVMF